MSKLYLAHMFQAAIDSGEFTEDELDEAAEGLVAAMFEKDFTNCRLIDPSRFSERPWTWQFGVRLARLMAPIL